MDNNLNGIVVKRSSNESKHSRIPRLMNFSNNGITSRLFLILSLFQEESEKRSYTASESTFTLDSESGADFGKDKLGEDPIFTLEIRLLSIVSAFQTVKYDRAGEE